MRIVSRLKLLLPSRSRQRPSSIRGQISDLDRRFRVLEAQIAELKGSSNQGDGHGAYTGFDLEHANVYLPYRPDRVDLRVRFLQRHMTPAQPASLWIDTRSASGGPALLGRREELLPGDIMRILDDRSHDLSVGVLMVKVFHERVACEGYITVQSLVAETTEKEESLWVAENRHALREVVESASEYGVLYSTNRISPVEVADSNEFLAQFGIDGISTDELLGSIHPLQAGAHAHRIGIWALSSKRSSEERARVAEMLDRMFGAYGVPAMDTIGDAGAWPYRFEFAMPWGTKLTPPWYSGYANSAMTGAAACAFALTGKPIYRDVVKRGVAFLRRPMADGGALYRANGYQFIAEYCYESPPIPNYRVLDGELCSVVYLYNAALILSDASLLDWVIDLWPGLAHALDMFCVEKDGLPVFGMDGQPMNPDYMWQLWMNLQLLANCFKDRRFALHAKRWRDGIPQQHIDDGHPL